MIESSYVTRKMQIRTQKNSIDLILPATLAKSHHWTSFLFQMIGKSLDHSQVVNHNNMVISANSRKDQTGGKKTLIFNDSRSFICSSK